MSALRPILTLAVAALVLPACSERPAERGVPLVPLASAGAVSGPAAAA